MKIIFPLITLSVALITYFVFFKKNIPVRQEVKAQKTNIPAENNETNLNIQGTKLTENPYNGLKRQAYSVPYSMMGLPDPGDKEVLYGVLMDWDYEGKAIVTLLAFKSGDMSIYLSTGAVIIGGGQFEEGRKLGKDYIDKAQSLLPLANKKDTALITEKGMLKFYLLTNKGKYVVKDQMEKVTDRTSDLTEMFREANKLVTFMRLKEQEKSHSQK